MKRLLSLLLTFMIVGTLFIGCGNTTKEETADSSVEAGGSDSNIVYNWRVWTYRQ